jgi:hypothetical protein
VYAQITVETYTETGFIEMTDQGGKTSYFNFNWDQASSRRGGGGRLSMAWQR